MKNRRGVVLIVVLGILFILALLATAFLTLATTERFVSRNYLDTVRARMIARSGIEVAISRIQSGIQNDPSILYWGDNMTEAGQRDTKLPLEQARNPSYAYEDEARQNPLDPNVAPLQLTLSGQSRGISGLMNSGTYGPNGDVYRLRVEDANGR